MDFTNSREKYLESDANEIRRIVTRTPIDDERIKIGDNVFRREILIDQLSAGVGISTNLLNILSKDLIKSEMHKYLNEERYEAFAVRVNRLRNQNMLLRQLIAELSQENQVLKKRLINSGKTAV